jgi:superfamily II DNA or RNA helicase
LDVGIELPTGAGKTLIALLVAEAWRRAGKRVVILSANKTLARQMDSDVPPSTLNRGILPVNCTNYETQVSFIKMTPVRFLWSVIIFEKRVDGMVRALSLCSVTQQEAEACNY